MTLTFELLPVDRHSAHDGNFWRMTDTAKREFARKILVRARTRGLVDGRKCCVCGSQNAEGHHDCYDRPYEVAWLCKRHHHARQNEINLASPIALKPKGFIPPELRVGPQITRQYRSLLKRKAAGVCQRCEGTPLATKTHCLKCAIAVREYQRKRNGCTRANDCASRRLQSQNGNSVLNGSESASASSKPKTVEAA